MAEPRRRRSRASSELKARLEEARREAERAERAADLQRAAEMRYGEIPELEAGSLAAPSGGDDGRARTTHAATRAARGANRQTRSSSRRRSTPTTSPRSSRAGPASRSAACSRAKSQKLIHMEERLHERVIGQDEAVEAVANALRRSRAGLQDPDRPIGSFLFLGPTGVGKTELARALAEFMFDTQDAMVRIDMSEYMERHTVSRLVGAPPGYVGYDEGGQLTEAVRRRPYSVVLLDEIEKAHPDVFNVLLAVLDDGRLTDGQGRTVDFKNTVLIMTSNIRGRRAADVQLREALLEHFKPEFINRLDDIVEFAPLTREQLGEIVELQLARVIERLAARGIELKLTDAARELLGNLGYDPVYGARPLKRVIQKQLVDRLALGLLDGEFRAGDTVRVDAEHDRLKFERATATTPV